MRPIPNFDRSLYKLIYLLLIHPHHLIRSIGACGAGA